MKKLMLAGTAAALLAGTAVAGENHNLKWDMRFDFVKKNVEKDATSSKTKSETKTQGFETNRMRLYSWGKVNETISYTAEVNFKDPSARSPQLSLNDAKMIKKLGHGLSFELGYDGQLLGGIENDYSGASTYKYSDTVNDIWASTGYDDLGITLRYKPMKGQRVSFRVMDTEKHSKRQAMQLSYDGDFMSRMIQFKASYSINPQEDKAGKDQDYTAYAAGVKFAHTMFDVEADYMAFDGENVNYDEKLYSDTEGSAIVGTLRYKVNKQFNVAAKYMTEEYKAKTANTEDYDGTGYVVNAEYQSAKDAYFRYHLAYTRYETDYKEASVQDETETKVIAGIRMKVNFL